MNFTDFNSTFYDNDLTFSDVETKNRLGRKLRLAGFKDYPPLVQFSKCPTWSMKMCSHPGSDVEFLKIVLKIAGLDYEVVQHNYLTQELIPALSNGSVDMSLVALRVTENRMHDVRYTTPINYLQFGYLAKELDRLESDDFLTRTFHWDVYVVLFASMLLMALIFRVAFYFSRRNLLEFVWFAFATFFNQDKRMISYVKRISNMLLCILWVYFSWVVILFYQAELKYYLTVPLRHGVAFRELQEVLDAMEYQGWIGVQNVNGYGPGLYCKPEQCEQFERIKAKGRLLVIPQDDDAGLTDNLMKGYRVGFAAFTVDLAPSDISVYDMARRFLFIRDDKLSYEMLAFAMNPNLTIELEKVNRALSQVLSSYSTIRGRYVPPYNAYRDEVDTDVVVLTNIHLKDVYNLVFILFTVSFLCLLIEHFYYQSRWRWYSFEEELQGRSKVAYNVDYLQRIFASYWYRDTRL